MRGKERKARVAFMTLLVKRQRFQLRRTLITLTTTCWRVFTQCIEDMEPSLPKQPTHFCYTHPYTHQTLVRNHYYSNTSDSVTEWHSNMNPRDAGASKIHPVVCSASAKNSDDSLQYNIYVMLCYDILKGEIIVIINMLISWVITTDFGKKSWWPKRNLFLRDRWGGSISYPWWGGLQETCHCWKALLKNSNGMDIDFLVLSKSWLRLKVQ